MARKPVNNKINNDLLVRLEERVITLQEKVDELHKAIDINRNETKNEYITKKEFAPVQRAVYAAIGFILTGFIGSLVLMVFKSGLIP